MDLSSICEFLLADPEPPAMGTYVAREYASERGGWGDWHSSTGRAMMHLRLQRIPSISIYSRAYQLCAAGAPVSQPDESRMKAAYVLTTFSPTMFGEGATVHIKIISAEEAISLVDETTEIVASRTTHERLARQTFPNTKEVAARYSNMRSGTVGILLHYRGPPIPDTGHLPVGGMVTFYLIEVESYQSLEAA